MGGVYSRLRECHYGISVLRRAFADSNAEFSAMITRITSPTFPVQNPTESFWLERPLFPELVDMKSAQLPETADIIIIGSGISGASIAHTILTESQQMGIERKVLVLEGRSLCSGATARNGGHIKVAPYVEYADAKKRFGAERAKKLLNFQMMHLSVILKVGEIEKLEGTEAREVQTADAFMDVTMWKKAMAMVEDLKADLPDIAKGLKILDAEAARKQLGFSDHCVGAITYRTGAIWAYGFVTSLHAAMLSNFSSLYSIETGTLVEQVCLADDGETPFLVRTSRGNITAKHVVYATDAFLANHVPSLVGKIFPLRGHMSAQRPGKSFPEYNGSRSWSIVGGKGFEYVTQRPGKPDGHNGCGAEIMIGGGMFQTDGKGIEELGDWTDDKTNHQIASYLSGVLSVSFSSKTWGEDADGSRVKKIWSGSQGFTTDLLPYVGILSPSLTGRKPGVPAKTLVPGSTTPVPAEWVSAGFNGQGMVMAWLSGVATGLMVLGREKTVSDGASGRPRGRVADWLPEELVMSPERIAKSSIYEFASLVS